MENTKKMEILNRLIKEGAIDLAEALILLETEKEYVPYIQPTPFTNPCSPFTPNNYPLNPFIYTSTGSRSYTGPQFTCN